MISLVILGLVLATVYRIAGTSIAAVGSRSDDLELALIAEAVIAAAAVHQDATDIEKLVPLPSNVDMEVSWAPLAVDVFGEDPGLPEDLDQRLQLIDVRLRANDGRRFQLRSISRIQDERVVE